MAWRKIAESLRRRLRARFGRAVSSGLGKVRVRDVISASRQARYGISRQEANRCASEWISDPGVLDDWNDTRSILDM